MRCLLDPLCVVMAGGCDKDVEEILRGEVYPPYLGIWFSVKTISITYTVEKCPTGKETQCSAYRLHSGMSLLRPVVVLGCSPSRLHR